MHISFIIPVYNVEKYIEKAIMSVVNNHWGKYEFEIVIIDDESPDNSVEVVNNIKIQNSNSNINIISQKNKGLGGARNTGIANAKGDYLFFLDSDDYILPDIFPKLLDQAYADNLDVLEFAAERVDENYNKIDTIFQNNTNQKVLSGEEYVKDIDFANSACNKLYKRDFLISQNIIFLEKVYIEDAPFNVEVFLEAQKVSACELVAAAFLQNTTSITRATRSGKYLEKFINDSIKVTGRINELSNQFSNGKSKNKIRQKTAYFLAGIFRMIFLNREITSDQKRIFVKNLKSFNLLPFYQNSGSFPRNLILYFFNFLNFIRII